MFYKITNKLFYNTEKDNRSIYKLINNDKVLLVLAYLYLNSNRNNVSLFSIEDIIITFGFTPKSGEGKINEQIYNIILKLKELKIIEFCDLKPFEYKLKQLYKCKFKIDLQGQFFILDGSEMNTILNQNVEKIDNVKLLVYYSYLKSKMYVRSKDIDINRDGGKAESCYPKFEDISKDINLNEGIIKKYNDVLVGLNLIRIGNAGLYYFKSDNNKKRFESANTYVLYKDGWEDEIKRSIKAYKAKFEDRVFVNSRDYKNNNKSVNGYIARIQYLQSIGKAKEKQIEKLNELIEIKALSENADNVKFSIKSLLDDEAYEGMTLSEIYAAKNMHSLSEKYEDIEHVLGIVENNQIIIDWDKYKWLMINYNQDKHDYYYNCAKKYVREALQYKPKEQPDNIDAMGFIKKCYPDWLDNDKQEDWM